jgi:hypothetical protein
MVKPISLMCSGKSFPSIIELARYYKVHPSTVARRIRDGWSVEESVGLENKKRAGHGKKVIVNGKSYKTIKEACVDLNLNPATIRARIQQGYSTEDAFKGKFKEKKSGVAKLISYQGIKYPSIEAIGEAYQVKPSVISKRLKRGWTLSQALNQEDAPPRFRNFEGHARNIKWKTTRTSTDGIEPIPDAEGYKLYLLTNTKTTKEYVGITIGSLEKRLKSHFSAVRRGRKSALSNAIRKYGEKSFCISLIRCDAKSFNELQSQEIDEIAKRNSIKNGYNTAVGGSLGTAKSITVNGKKFPSIAQAAEHYGIDISVFYLRINRLKWTPEEAAEIVSKDWVGKELPITLLGTEYQSLRAAATELNINYKLVHDRYRMKNWTLEQAFGLEEPPASAKFSGINITINNIKYSSIAKAANELNIPKETLRKKLSEGLSPDDAYTQIISSKRSGI